MENRCLICDEIIPEGRQVCPICEESILPGRRVQPIGRMYISAMNYKDDNKTDQGSREKHTL